MKDKLKSYNMTNGESYRNKIKGHVQIDLHDTRTGFNERIEKYNLVTNALDAIRPFCLSDPNRFFSPIAKNSLGGIMLFENELEEVATNVCLPVDSHLVGMAGLSSETNSFYGTFNPEESEVIDNGYKSVWDFATNQCVGQIGAVARTHSAILYATDISPQADSSHSMSQAGLTAYDLGNDGIYGMKYDAANGYLYFYDNNDKKVKRTKYFPNLLGVCDEFRDYYGTYNLKPYEVEEVADVSSSGLTLTYPGYRQPDGYAYRGTNYSNPGGITVSLTITRINCDDFTVETKTFNTTALNVALSSLLWAVNGYFYYISSDSKRLVKINWNNPADMVEVIKESDGYTVIGGAYYRVTKNGVVIDTAYKNGSYVMLYIYPDDSIVERTAFSSSGCFPNAMQLSDGTWLGTNQRTRSRAIYHGFLDYLGTIANVGPFQKNSTQTMKITYSLTNAS